MSRQLRRLALYKQGLLSKHQFGKGLSGTTKAVEHLGYVQIDTLFVVERAHHHVLWSRVPGYDPCHLNLLIKKQKVFEYWYHAASYLPMRDYRFALPHMNTIRRGEYRYYTNVDTRLMKEILVRVQSEGELRIRDLDKGNKKSETSWWNWGPGRLALERLYMQGDLMVCERNGMEKIYDLTERCLPSGIDISEPTISEYANYLLDTTIRAHGVFTWKQLMHLKTGKPLRDTLQKHLDERIDAGKLEVVVNPNSPALYVDHKALEKKMPSNDGEVKLLSPFDNAVIHRDRLSSLFNFEYTIECYVPASKRVYGYFCLPILYGDKFVGRIDCKAHRADKRLEVLSLHLEAGRFNRAKFFPALRNELKRFADFNNCPQIDDKVVNKVKNHRSPRK